MPQLDEFAEHVEPTMRCYTCKLPQSILEQVNDARMKKPPIKYDTISAWLETEGHTIKTVTLINHFRFGHHTRKSA